MTLSDSTPVVLARRPSAHPSAHWELREDGGCFDIVLVITRLPEAPLVLPIASTALLSEASYT